MPDAHMMSRTIIQNGPLGFPMDLSNQELQVPERFQQVNGVHAILDTDASQEGRQPFDLTKLRERLDDLHNRIRVAFEANVTPIRPAGLGIREEHDVRTSQHIGAASAEAFSDFRFAVRKRRSPEPGPLQPSHARTWSERWAR